MLETIAERAGIELKDDDGKPFHCGKRMPTNSGIMGPDSANCRTCGLAIFNAASPHVNGGFTFPPEVMKEYEKSDVDIREESQG